MRKKVSGLLVLVTIIGIVSVYMQAQRDSRNQVIKQIISSSQEEVDDKLLQDALAHIRKENVSEKEALILGFGALKSADLETAKTYLNKARTSKDESIRLHAADLLVSILAKQEANEEIATIVDETLKSLTSKSYNNEITTITSLTQYIIHTEEDRKRTIGTLQYALEHTPFLNNEAVCSIKNKIALLYLYNGNYARAMENLLGVMAVGETLDDKFYRAKAQVDLGIIYGMLGNYKESSKNFKEVLEIEVKDVKNEAFIKVYAIINLYENMLYEENYEDVQEVHDMVMTYAEHLDETLKESILMMNDIFLCKYYMKIGELTLANDLKKKLDDQIEVFKVYEPISVYANYKLLCAQMAEVDGDVDLAVSLYKETLKLENMPYTKYILKYLVKLLNQYERYEEAHEYKAELIKHYRQEAMTLSRNYSEYALYKYEYKQHILEKTQLKIRMYIYGIFIAGIIIGGIIRSYLKNKKLIEVNRLDGLAKAYNRRYFEEYYKALKEDELPFAIILFDIDYFKKINDTYGHLVGDMVIKQVVEISKEVMLDKGKVFRYGGEEFAAILEDKTIEEVYEIAESIRKDVEAYQWENDMKVTVSIGVAQTTDTIRDIFNMADQNLYTAKKQGRNQVIYETC